MSADRFDLRGRVAVVTGGYGILGASLADALAGAGAWDDPSAPIAPGVAEGFADRVAAAARSRTARRCP